MAIQGSPFRMSKCFFVASALLVMLAPPAAADSERIEGHIGCINSQHPVGVWVQAKDSKSGWADIHMPVYLGSLSKVDYSYLLDRGGEYQVHVGCGGTPDHWASDIHSDDVSGSHNFLCNDITEIDQDAWNAIANEVVGVFKDIVHLDEGVPRNHCNVV